MAETYDDRVSHSEHGTRYIKKRVTDIVDTAPTLDSDDDSTENKRILKLKPALITSVVAGGIAGVTVDISLYPLDTIKTRLQSEKGFQASGGFKGVYKGIIPVLLASAPLSGLFFATYNTLINTLRSSDSSLNPLVYLVASSAAELVCATVRVPVEIIKQRKQTSNSSSSTIIKNIVQKEGFLGFYRGFLSTLLREIPFAAIQFPLWEYMINQFIIYQNGKELTALQTAYCGAVAGAIAAATTTPMDVIKTQMMLAEKEKLDIYKKNLNLKIAKEIFMNRGIKGFFAGVTPRVLWIMLGGFIYFGSYEKSKLIIENNWSTFTEKIHVIRESATSPSYLEEKIESIFSEKRKCKEKEEDDDEECKKLATEEEMFGKAEAQKIIDTTLLQPSKRFLRED